MYIDGKILGASTTGGGAVAALPLTAGNSVFQMILIATAIIAVAILIVRIVKITSSSKAI